jgi:ribonuclease E
MPAAQSTPDDAALQQAPRRRAAKKLAASVAAPEPATTLPELPTAEGPGATEPPKPARRTRKRAAEPTNTEGEPAEGVRAVSQPPVVLFQTPEVPLSASRTGDEAADGSSGQTPAEDTDDEDDELGEGARPRRRRRGGRGRRPPGRAGRGEEEGDGEAPGGEAEDGADRTPRLRAEPTQQAADAEDAGEFPGEPRGDASDDDDSPEGGATRRRRRRRRKGTADDVVELAEDDPPNTVVRVREPRKSARKKAVGEPDDDGVRSIKGSTRLEAKKQRRRDGRDAGRKRPSIITEAEFLARRESVDRVMVVRQSGELTQIAVLEDGVLVEHYVANASAGGLLGNVYLGKVQNVLPSMEAAFVDVGKGRNAVLYAGEVNWDAAGLEGQPRRIELALKSGDPVLTQVTKDSVGHKGARLTSQISLPGRYLVYVPGNPMTGISRKLPDTERTRLKSILKKIVPDDAGVIVRTAAEGASEEELSRDVARLTAQWEDIQKKAKTASAPALLYGEPDLTIRVVRDIFNEDFAKLIVSGEDAWDVLDPYVAHVAPDLRDRLTRWNSEEDVFAANRIDEQLAKAMDRKVWLPSGGYLVIDRTEAMTVVDVNTGKFTGQGGNLEETVTKNNLESAEEIVRQLRLRDVGGIIVIDFIDMVLESNRDLVLRRLLECLGRDRTKHQVAEVTSLGLVQMTRKRVGQGLFEAFSEICDSCNGRGVHIRTEPLVASGLSGAPGDRSDGDRKPGGGRKGGPRSPKPAPPTASPVALEDPVEPHDTDASPPSAEAPSVDTFLIDAVDDGRPAESADDVAAGDNGAAPAPVRRRRRTARSV